MHPILAEFPLPLIGNLRLYGFGVCVVIGVFAALSIATRLGLARGIHPDRIGGLGFVTVIAGLLGARLFYYVQFQDQFSDRNATARVLRVEPDAPEGVLIHPSLLKFANAPARKSVDVSGNRSASSARLPVSVSWVPASDEVILRGPAASRFAKGEDVRLLWKRSLWSFFAIWEGGIVYYGGLLAGIAFGLLYIWFHRIPLRPLLDAVAPALAVGLAFGRIGCLLNGCCFGAPCPADAPYGIQFPATWGADEEQVVLRDGEILKGRIVSTKDAAVVIENGSQRREIPQDQIQEFTQPNRTPAFDYQVRHAVLSPDAAITAPVYPTQILSSLDAFLLFGILLWLSRRPRPAGALFFLWLSIYPVQRFIEEALRADNAPVLLGMTISQAIGVPIFLAGVIGLVSLRGRPVWTPPPPAEPVPPSD